MVMFWMLMLLVGVMQMFAIFRRANALKKNIQMRAEAKTVNFNKNDVNKLSIIELARGLVWQKVVDSISVIVSFEQGLNVKNVLTLAVPIIVGAVVNQSVFKFNHLVVFVVVSVVTIFVIHVSEKNKKKIKFESEFSEVLGIVNGVVRIGQPIMFAIEECAKLKGNALGGEFRKIVKRLNIGDEPERVFTSSYYKYQYDEYLLFVITVLINLRGGGEIGEVISRLNAQIAANRVLERKKKSMTAEARMSVKILAVIPILFFVFIKIISPDNFDILINTVPGRFILLYAVGSIGFGLLIVWSMMKKAV